MATSSEAPTKVHPRYGCSAAGRTLNPCPPASGVAGGGGGRRRRLTKCPPRVAHEHKHAHTHTQNTHTCAHTHTQRSGAIISLSRPNEEEPRLNSTAWMRIKLGSDAEGSTESSSPPPLKFTPAHATGPKFLTGSEQKGRGSRARVRDGDVERKKDDLRRTLLGLGCLRRDIVARMMMVSLLLPLLLLLVLGGGGAVGGGDDGGGGGGGWMIKWGEGPG